MGYTTDFSGQFDLNKPLAPEHKAYLERFAGSRRMKRDSKIVEKFNDPLRVAAGLPVGKDGEFFVGSDEADKEVFSKSDPRYSTAKFADNEPQQFGSFAGQRRDSSVVDYNSPPKTQPGLWCQWVPNEDGTAIQWDGGEKFYDYVEWIEYIIDNFLNKWGYKLNGTVEWVGEDPDDRGRIVIKNNKVTKQIAEITYRDE